MLDAIDRALKIAVLAGGELEVEQARLERDRRERILEVMHDLVNVLFSNEVIELGFFGTQPTDLSRTQREPWLALPRLRLDDLNLCALHARTLL